jgi:hypothetical protein
VLSKIPRNFGGTIVTDLSYISRASHDVHLIYTSASSLQFPLEQMNEGDESLPSTETRKKRRGSGSDTPVGKTLNAQEQRGRLLRPNYWSLFLLQRHYRILEDYLVVMLLDQVAYIALT